MHSTRSERVAGFRQEILAGKPASCDTLFRMLYGIPSELQIELARFMTARYLPIFRSHRADLHWVESALDDVDGFFSATAGGRPEPDPDDIVQGDGAFTTCVALLGRAWSHAKQNNRGRLTAACGAILINAVAARAANVWRADEPVAAHAFEIGEDAACAGSDPCFNVASQAVTKREWLVVADWLDEHAIASHRDIRDDEVAEREEALAAWRDREYLF